MDWLNRFSRRPHTTGGGGSSSAQHLPAMSPLRVKSNQNAIVESSSPWLIDLKRPAGLIERPATAKETDLGKRSRRRVRRRPGPLEQKQRSATAPHPRLYSSASAEQLRIEENRKNAQLRPRTAFPSGPFPEALHEVHMPRARGVNRLLKPPPLDYQAVYRM